MKVRGFLRTYDAFYLSAEEVANAQAPKVGEASTGAGAHPSAARVDEDRREMRDAISGAMWQWVEFDEAIDVTLEFDAKTGTARVVPLSERAED